MNALIRKIEQKPMLNRKYLAFGVDTSEEMAEIVFRNRFGYSPTEIVEYKGLLYVGPVNVEDEDEQTS